eukprot:TRINITY_DN12116_c0_g1_i2.p1 TRINITY_DN12116_c0_g1~~TRINITY_DN12116_c0_g1_i2.p1  ORF type:complete len:941 (-),score=193.42 TRINITY_DN12116_c0_g1_i2:227-3049(-)
MQNMSATLPKILLLFVGLFLIPTVLLLMSVSHSLIHNEEHFDDVLVAVDNIHKQIEMCQERIQHETKRANDCLGENAHLENQIDGQMQDLWNLTQQISKLEGFIQKAKLTQRDLDQFDANEKKPHIQVANPPERVSSLKDSLSLRSATVTSSQTLLANIIIPITSSKDMETLVYTIFSISQHTKPLIPTKVIVLYPDLFDPLDFILNQISRKDAVWPQSESTTSTLEYIRKTFRPPPPPPSDDSIDIPINNPTDRQSKMRNAALTPTRPIHESIADRVSKMDISEAAKYSITHVLEGILFLSLPKDKVVGESDSPIFPPYHVTLGRLLNEGIAVIPKAAYCAFVSPSTMVDSDWLDQLLKPYQEAENVGMVFGLATEYDYAQDENKILSAGLEPVFSNQRWYFAPRFPGHSLKYRKANLTSYQQAIAGSFPSAILINTNFLRSTKVFNISMCAEFEDFALRTLLLWKKKVIFSPKSMVHRVNPVQQTTDSPTTFEYGDDADIDYYQGNQKTECDTTFDIKWGDVLEKMVKSKYLLHSTIVWDLFCGCTGFNVEAINYLVPLERQTTVRSVAFSSCFCEGFPQNFANILERTTTNEILLNETVIWISHKPADAIPRFPYRGNLYFPRHPHYVIGRTMTEVDLLKPHWADYCNNDTYYDEIWVPSQHSYEIFVKNGVKPHRLHRIPEALDVDLYDPEITKAAILPGQPSGFNFLSVFKWEDRKGWQYLLRAYFREFRKKDDVALNIHTYLFGHPNPRNESAIWDRIHDFAHLEGFNRSYLPRINIISEEVATWKMPQLYKACDAFVLPTRGEGWGLPIMEAMSMGLPVIATAWGGNMDFMNSTNSYPIKVEKLEEATGHDFAVGGKWATPSVPHLRQLMRHVFKNRHKAALVGKKARESIVENFSQEAVNRVVLQRLLQVEKIAKERWRKHPNIILEENEFL